MCFVHRKAIFNFKNRKKTNKTVYLNRNFISYQEGLPRQVVDIRAELPTVKKRLGDDKHAFFQN